MRLQRNLPIVDGTINGNKVGILLDTGSMASVVTLSNSLVRMRTFWVSVIFSAVALPTK